MPPKKSTPEMEIQRSPRSVSSGKVSGWTGSAAVPTGIRSAMPFQPAIASPAAAAEHLVARCRPVIASAAGFQRRIVPVWSTRTTPSAT